MHPSCPKKCSEDNEKMASTKPIWHRLERSQRLLLLVIIITNILIMKSWLISDIQVLETAKAWKISRKSTQYLKTWVTLQDRWETCRRRIWQLFWNFIINNNKNTNLNIRWVKMTSHIIFFLKMISFLQRLLKMKLMANLSSPTSFL